MSKKGLVCTLHPKLNAIYSILKKNFHLISNDPRLSKKFLSNPVAYRKNKTLSGYLLKSDIAYQQFYSHISLSERTYLSSTMFKAQDLVYWSNRRTSLRDLF